MTIQGLINLAACEPFAADDDAASDQQRGLAQATFTALQMFGAWIG